MFLHTGGDYEKERRGKNEAGKMKNDVAAKKEKERKNLSSHVKIEAERADGGLEPHSKLAEGKSWMWPERESPEAQDRIGASVFLTEF